ncbi:SLAM family member 7-like isoform X2 [Acanthopagrus latus]|uniref:SLAM family member 7-like isoform X2 n=1 Tax=Acanthopagrus latus TaxID=8177 RepID=UPI00187CA062|nr:SLAM family member 7-like isoform X2 [Acanthopagrus latus]
MADIPLVFTVILVYFSQMQGSSAVTPVFVLKGDDVMLNLTEADDLENSAVFWNFTDKSSNEESVLVKWRPGTEPEVSPGYRGRIEFPVNRCCVNLKNLQETDSGVYTGHVMGAVGLISSTEYKVTVQDPVSPVKLTVDSVSNSSDSCNLTVTCSTQDSHISSTFTCDAKTCSQEGGERSEVTTSGASLRVYLVNDSITCNHSNQVSWTKNVTNIQDFCPCCAEKTESTEDAVYAVPEMEALAQPLDPTSDSSSPPSAIYSLLEPHTGPTRPTEETEIVYSTI